MSCAQRSKATLRFSSRAGTLALVAASWACTPSATAPAATSPRAGTAPPPAAGALVVAPPSPSRTPAQERAHALVEQMTLQEKVAALVHVWDWSRSKTPAQLCEIIPEGAGSFERIGLDREPAVTVQFVNELRDCVVRRSRLHIPPFFLDEGVHGFMQKGATSFPAAVALGATWDPALVQQIFGVVAKEARSRGTNWILGPNLDLAREPRWGRSDEMYSEDPFLVAQFGVAAIRGLQGTTKRIDDSHVFATAKHFAAHGQPEAGANGGPVNVSERVLRGEFLVPFEAAVQQGRVGAVMAAYNEIDGIPGHINSWLLGQVLRKEWGFGGLVISDGMGVERLESVHHVASGRGDAARQALMAGVDYEIGTTYLELAKEVDAGRVPLARLDEAVERTLTVKVELGLFEAKPLDATVAVQVNNAPAHRQLALQAAREGAVLLSNDGVLPLERGRLKRVAVIGPNAAKAHLGGYSADPGRGVSLLDGIRQAAGSKIEVRYARGCNITSEDLTWEGHWKAEVKLPDAKGERQWINEAVRAARGADVIILALGENEATSRETWTNHLGDRDSLALLGAQNELVGALAATKVPIVTVVFNGRPLEIGDVVARSRATIEAFYLGQETGTALGEILFGDVAPSGHLPITMPKSVGQLPVYYYRKPSARSEDYLFSAAKPLFPFGWGLTYTTFEHSEPTVSPLSIQVGESASVSVLVKNTGSRAGTDVLQLYVGAETSSVTRPVRLLAGFARVELQPGEARQVRFEVTPQALAMWDASMQRRVEPGKYVLELGSNSSELVRTTLEVRPR
jgi:beta-glucosidase